jgi:hypothetical protein
MAANRSTVVGVFDDIDQAEKAVRDLRQAGFEPQQIGFIMKDPSKEDAFQKSALQEFAPDAERKSGETGAVLGGALGGMLGVLVAGMFPGVGAAILGASLLATIGSGAAVGGLVGALVGMGLPKEEARFYQEEYEAGRPILTVRTDERFSEAMSILSSNGAYDVNRPMSSVSG